MLYYNRSQKKDLDAQGCRKVELDELCTECDIISVHVMATPQTFHLLDKTKFAIMKPNGAMCCCHEFSLIISVCLRFYI
eukprot:SAG31_NODE_632_length_13389_cov_4.818360_4_plen_79_part_00